MAPASWWNGCGLAGCLKPKLQLDAWLKEVGPSTELRKWFSHDPEKWREFRRRYFRELDSRPEAWQPIVSAARRGSVTLVYSSHDTEHNNAVALQEYVQAKSRRPAKSRRAAAAHRRAVSAVNPRDGSPASLSHVRAAASSAVPAGSHGVGTAASSAQSDRPLGWHHISTCNRHWRTADRTRRAAGGLVCRAEADRDGNAAAADAARRGDVCDRSLIGCSGFGSI